MKIRLPYATVLLNLGVFAGFLPSLYSTRFVGFSCPCAATGTAAAVAAAAATAPRPKNFRRFVVLINVPPLIKVLSAPAAGAILMPLCRPARLAILPESHGARHFRALRLAGELIRDSRAFRAVAALEAHRVRRHRPRQIARRELAMMCAYQFSAVLFQHEGMIHRPAHELQVQFPLSGDADRLAFRCRGGWIDL